MREWLGAMVTWRAVTVDPDGPRFTLPWEHAACLTRAAGANHVAVFAQYISLLGNVGDDIVECFTKGGGVPYSRFPRFHAVMAENSGVSVMSSLESHILPLVPGLAERLAEGIRALDAGCGSGRALNRLAELFPKSRFVGLDFSQEAIQTARRDASARGLNNVEFAIADLGEFGAARSPRRSTSSRRSTRCTIRASR